MTDEQRAAAHEAHWREQVRWIADNTTAEQRLQWLEDTLRFLFENGLIPNKMDLVGTWPEPGER